MHPVLEWMGRILPEDRQVLRRRFRILYELRGPRDMGRRILAARTGFSEAVLRKECERLSEAGLLKRSRDGMRLTSQGEEWLLEARSRMEELYEDMQLEDKLAEALAGWHVYLDPSAAPRDCSRVREAKAALEGVKPEARRILREREAYCEWDGFYYDVSGRLIYRRRDAYEGSRKVCIGEEIREAQAVRGLLAEHEGGAVWMSRELGRHLWKIIRKEDEEYGANCD